MITLTKCKAVLLASVIAFTLAACNEDGEFELREPEERPDTSGRLFDSLINRGADGTLTGSGGAGLPINQYLWRASLDTIAFMPLNSADPFGGVILTDWYSPPATPNERFKVTVYILDRRLRVDAIKTAVFRQVRGGLNQAWQDAATRPETALELEDAILTRARQLRVNYTDALD